MRHILPFFVASAYVASCGGSSPLPPMQSIVASVPVPAVAAASDSSTPPPSPDTAWASCRDDNQCGAASMCLGERCISRCGASPPTNLVQNAGFDRDVWVGADKDRGAGPRLP